MYKCSENDVCLCCGKWNAVVLPDFGMNVVMLRYDGRSVLREPYNREHLSDNPYTYGIPLLFPANRTQNGSFSFNGECYSLPLNEPQRGNHIHGMMYDAPFTVTEKGRDRLSAVYENYGERFPFPFRMTVTDILGEEGLTRTLVLENIGETPMPYTLAYHTSFCEPGCFCVPIGKRYLCNENFIPLGETVTLTETERKYIFGTEPRNLKISGFYTSTGNKAYLDRFCFSVSNTFDEWVLFNGGGGQEFLCIEPQCGEVNGLNTSSGHRVLQSGEKTEFIIKISLEERR